MSRILIILISFLCVTLAEGKTRVAISKFKDKTGNGRCNLSFWGNRLSQGFRDQIATALMKSRKVNVVERENLKNMYNEEHGLINADTSTLPTKNRFKAAHYSITGAVTQFELCSGGLKGKVDVGSLIGIKNSGLKVGAGRASAKVAIDMRIIDTETGEVVMSFESTGKSSKVGFDIDGDYKGANFSSDAFRSSPIGKATKIAIKKAVKKIVKGLPKKRDSQIDLANTSVPKSNPSLSKKRSRGKSSRSKAARARSGKSRDSFVCNILDDYWGNYVACRVISLSKTGSRVKVLNQKNGKFAFTTPDKVFKLRPLSKSPDIGDTYYVNSVAAGMCSGCKKQYRTCRVTDSLDGEYILNCRGKEFSMAPKMLYGLSKVSFKKPASTR